MSSGAYRSALAPAKARLTVLFNAAKKRDYKIPEGITNEDKLKLMKKLIKDAAEDLAKIEAAAKTIEKWNEKWIELMVTLDKTKYAEEESLYKTIAEGEDGYLKHLDTAVEANVQLNAIIRQLQDDIASLISVDGHSSPIITNAAVSLPPTNIPFFYGDVARWKNFWDIYVAAVDCKPIPDIQKLTFLLSKIRGKAAAAVRGYAVTSDNYPIIVDILKKRFGSTNHILVELHAELKNLPRSRGNIMDIRRTFEKIEKICRQLEEIGEDTKHPQMLITIESKLPTWVLREIYKDKIRAVGPLG